MAYDEGLAERIREVFDARFCPSEKKMFGGLCFMLHGHMCCGVVKDRLMCRIGPVQYEAALALPHVRPMDFTGRKMTGFVFVDPPGIESDEDLARWVRLCEAFVGELPPK